MAAKLGDGTATEKWIEKAGSSDPDIQAAIIGMLGRRGDATALPYVRESLRSGDQAVRLAAIPAAGRLGGESAVADIFGLFGSADERTIAASKTVLLGFDARLVVPEASRRLDATPLPGKAAIIDLLGEKGARSEMDRIFTLAADPEPATRAAALGALARLAGEADLPRLVARLETATDGDDVLNLQNAVAAAARSNPDPALRGAALVGLMTNATAARKTAILRDPAEGRRPEGPRGGRRRVRGGRRPGPDGGGLCALPVARLRRGRRPAPDSDDDPEPEAPAHGRRRIRPPRRAFELDRSAQAGPFPGPAGQAVR